MLFVCLSSTGTREFFRTNIYGIKIRTGKILEENLVQSAFQETLGDKLTFQNDNNIKNMVKYTLELLS